ncbi:MAG: HAD-IIB family hydrolase [Nitrospiraceae bacterium]|nr:HAD-IIB family hydrolase [Nitrospiraceae bacterium]
MNRTVIFSDLDGTLLDPSTYSFEQASKALELIRKREIPLVLVSSKTRAEIEVWRARLGNQHPFISENGGGIFVPKGYFPFPLEGIPREGYDVISLGTPYESIRRRFADLRLRLGAAVRGFGDMTAEEVMVLTNLPREEAVLARQREFSEPFVFEAGADDLFLREIEGAGLRWTRGRFFHIMGDHHKGRAVTMLSRLYARRFGSLTTVGMGDNLNDLPFLLVVDRPVLVRKPPEAQREQFSFPGLLQTGREGPAGWNEAVLKLLDQGRGR